MRLDGEPVGVPARPRVAGRASTRRAGIARRWAMTEPGKRILFAEDDRATAASIAEALVERGFEVEVAHDGQAITARLGRTTRAEHWRRPVELSDREVETLTWAARGKTSAEIALIVGLTKRTVDFHIDNARAKLGVATRIEAAVRAAAGRLIEV